MGDFNIAPTDADVWDPAVFVDSTHVTPAGARSPRGFARDRPDRRGPDHRQGPAPVHVLGLPRRGVPQEHGHADRSGLRQRRGAGGLGVRAGVDREARKGKGPSDHAPVIVDLSL